MSGHDFPMYDPRNLFARCLMVMLIGIPGCTPSSDTATTEMASQDVSSQDVSSQGQDALPPVPPEPFPPEPWRNPATERFASPALQEMPTEEMPTDRGGAVPPQRSDFPLAVIDPRDATTERPLAEAPERGLRAGLSPDQLVDFLATADQDMQTIASGGGGISDPEQARTMLIQIIKMKQEASRRLADDPAIDESLRNEGQRGQLQALSHLASLGDLQAAKSLKSLAEKNLDSGNQDLVSDSRLVLIGFGIEDLQNGVPAAPESILGLVRSLAMGVSNTDVPAMMVMGQARQLLTNYGHDIEAKEVRDTIIHLFANSPDAQVAEMAAAMAGNVRFDAIDDLVEQAGKGEDVSTKEWAEAVQTLIDESADLQTVQYLSGAAIEFESQNNLALADVTYEVMQDRFTEEGSASYQELQMAWEARTARRSAMGREFDFSLPAIDQAPLSMKDYRGKIVLMPFWSIDFPQSIQILPKLRRLVDLAPKRIAVVGMNLDSDFRRVQNFIEKSGLDFRSFRAESSKDANSNPAAAQFGVVSLPCVVIFDSQGRVAKVDFAGRQLDEVVENLLMQ